VTPFGLQLREKLDEADVFLVLGYCEYLLLDRGIRGRFLLADLDPDGLLDAAAVGL